MPFVCNLCFVVIAMFISCVRGRGEILVSCYTFSAPIPHLRALKNIVRLARHCLNI